MARQRPPISAQAFEKSGCLRGCRSRYEMSRLGGGARRNRTADLFNAIEALSQLSYDPEPCANRDPIGIDRRTMRVPPTYSLAVQMVGTHVVAMDALTRAKQADHMPALEKCGALAEKLLRTVHGRNRSSRAAQARRRATRHHPACERKRGQVTTGTIQPGIVYMADTWQIAGGAALRARRRGVQSLRLRQCNGWALGVSVH